MDKTLETVRERERERELQFKEKGRRKTRLPKKTAYVNMGNCWTVWRE